SNFTQLLVIRRFCRQQEIGHRPWRLYGEPVQQQACLALDEGMEPLAVTNATTTVTTGGATRVLGNSSRQARQHVCDALRKVQDDAPVVFCARPSARPPSSDRSALRRFEFQNR